MNAHPAGQSCVLAETKSSAATTANSASISKSAFPKSTFHPLHYLRRSGRLDQKVQPLHTVEPWIGILLQRLLWIYPQPGKATRENAERDP